MTQSKHGTNSYKLLITSAQRYLKDVGFPVNNFRVGSRQVISEAQKLLCTTGQGVGSRWALDGVATGCCTETGHNSGEEGSNEDTEVEKDVGLVWVEVWATVDGCMPAEGD